MSSHFLLPLLEWARKLRYPTLFKITAALFLLDTLIPDILPFVDEILFGLATLLLANWKNRKETTPEPPASTLQNTLPVHVRRPTIRAVILISIALNGQARVVITLNHQINPVITGPISRNVEIETMLGIID